MNWYASIIIMDDWLLQWNAVVDGLWHHELCLCSFRELVYYRHILCIRCAQTLSECKTYQGISFINSNGTYIMPDYCAKLAERPRGCLQSNSTPVQIGNLAWGIMRP